MRLLGNIIWFILGGWWNFLVYAFLGVLFCITIIGIPIGKSMFQYAKLMALPFGKVIMKETEIKGKENVAAVRRVGGLIANIIWLPFGIVTFIANIGLMIASAITIIGIPVAIVIAKSCTFLLWPVGAKVITKEEAETIRMERSMMKVAGAAMAVNASMVAPQIAQQAPQAAIPATAAPQIASSSQTQVQAQPNQTLENLKAGGAQVLGSIKENGGKAAAAIAQTSKDGMTALKAQQAQMSEQILAQAKDISMGELLAQLEVKLYRNKIMAWIMPFLEYITLAVGILFVIIGIVLMAMLSFGGMGLYALMGGVLYGITMVSPLLLIAEILGMIKQKHIFVLVTLGVQLVARLVGLFIGFSVSVLEILVLIGVIVWYILTFMKKIDFAANKPVKQTCVQSTNVTSDSENVLGNGKHFCSQCGAECPEQVSFCPKCGNKLR